MARTARLLRLLDLLQSRPTWTGPQLADRLGVSTRSIRRDIEALRELGYPVQGGQGVGGGYRLGAGRGLPPLLLRDDEAVAVAVSLRLAAVGTVSGASEPALRTLAKLDQVMPPRLREQVRAIRDATVTLGELTDQVDGDALLALARACRDRVRVRFGYAARSGAHSQRDVEPVQLVATGRRWYLMAFDLDRADWRTFRLDRLSELRPTTLRCPSREHPDPVAFVQAAVAHRGHSHQALVRFDCAAAVLRRRVPATAGIVEPLGRGKCQLRSGADQLEWLAAYLVMLELPFEVLEPPELIDALRSLGHRMLAAADGR
jgi:predicted DNA-binding transcriptional regulator YafY